MDGPTAGGASDQVSAAVENAVKAVQSAAEKAAKAAQTVMESAAEKLQSEAEKPSAPAAPKKEEAAPKKEAAPAVPEASGKTYEDGIIEGLQQAVLARMEKNGPVTDQMRQDVKNNVYHDSLINWIKSF